MIIEWMSGVFFTAKSESFEDYFAVGDSETAAFYRLKTESNNLGQRGK
jgi:hypothetical protein